MMFQCFSSFTFVIHLPLILQSAFIFEHLTGVLDQGPDYVWRIVSKAEALPPLPESTPPLSPPLPPLLHSPLHAGPAPTLQGIAEGMTRNLALDEPGAEEHGFSELNIAPMKGGTSASGEARQEDLQVGIHVVET
jgi:hypothetical protein